MYMYKNVHISQNNYLKTFKQKEKGNNSIYTWSKKAFFFTGEEYTAVTRIWYIAIANVRLKNDKAVNSKI